MFNLYFTKCNGKKHYKDEIVELFILLIQFFQFAFLYKLQTDAGT